MTDWRCFLEMHGVLSLFGLPKHHLVRQGEANVFFRHDPKAVAVAHMLPGEPQQTLCLAEAQLR